MQTPVELGIQYRGLDFWLEILEYELDYDGEFEIEEFNITLDYGFSKDKYPTDDAARLVESMLADGKHLQEKILFEVTQEGSISHEQIMDELVTQSVVDEEDDIIGESSHMMTMDEVWFPLCKIHGV
jgi:hypothetical protein